MQLSCTVAGPCLLLLLLAGPGLATRVVEVQRETVCKSEMVPALPRTLGGQPDPFAVYKRTLQPDLTCQLMLDGPGGKFLVRLQKSPILRPAACYACPAYGSGPCAQPVALPDEPPLGDDCEYRLSNWCKYVKARRSDPTRACD